MLLRGRRFATAADVLDPDVPTRINRDLSAEELRRLALARIRRRKQFVSVRMFGSPDVIDKRRALHEIKRNSKVGRQLVEIERRYALLELEHHHRLAQGG
jgi:hypothetical protein